MAEIRVQVVYALPAQTLTCELCLPPGTTVGEALLVALGRPPFAALALGERAVAVWGRRAQPRQCLQAGDRLEILRELLQDPKEARRRRVSRSGGS